MDRRSFVAAGAVAAATTPLTAPKASVESDPAIEAVKALRAAERRCAALSATPEVCEARDRVVSVQMGRHAQTREPRYVHSVAAIDREEARDPRLHEDAPGAELVYRKTTDARRAEIRAFRERKRRDLKAQIEKRESDLKALGYTQAEDAEGLARERALTTLPTTPAGAAALLSLIDTDEAFIPNIIAALKDMTNVARQA